MSRNFMCRFEKHRATLITSVERFYNAPLVHDLSCEIAGGSSTLTFKTNTPFKMNGFHDGSYKIFDAGATSLTDHEALCGDSFVFAPFWRHTYVRVDLSSFAHDDGSFVGKLAVFDQWGDRALKHVLCTAATANDTAAPRNDAPQPP